MKNYLTPQELEQLISLKLSPNKFHLQKPLDVFLFSCYTGLKFSAIMMLKLDNIVTEDGKQWLTIKSKETKEVTRLPLDLLFDAKPIEILNRYTPRNEKSTIFQNIANRNNLPFAYMNRWLEEVVKRVGINRPITFDTARHTFVVYLLYKGVNITTIQKLLGHKELQETQQYIKSLDIAI